MARNRPTKSTVVQPHSSSLSRVPITYTTPRAQQALALFAAASERPQPQGTATERTCRLGTMMEHALSTPECPSARLQPQRGYHEDTQAEPEERYSSLLGQAAQPQPPLRHRPASARVPFVRLSTWQSAPVPSTSTRTIRVPPNHGHAPRRSGRRSCQRPAPQHRCREEHASRPQDRRLWDDEDREGGRERLSEGEWACLCASCACSRVWVTL